MKLINITSLILCILVGACSSAGKNSIPLEKSMTYQYTDVSGTYKWKRVVKLVNGNELVLKSDLYTDSFSGQEPVESVISISELGKIKGNRRKSHMARPKVSQYSVWFDKKKYFSQLKINLKKRSMDLLADSPEEKFNGKKSFEFPSSSALYCYFSQLVECVAATEFFKDAVADRKKGMRFYIVWDGYPYLSEVYSNMPNTLFTESSIAYDGMVDGFHKFSVSVSDQMIYYHLNGEFILKKMFWIAQGISANSI